MQTIFSWKNGCDMLLWIKSLQLFKKANYVSFVLRRRQYQGGTFNA